METSREAQKYEEYVRIFRERDRLGALLGARFVSLSSKECHFQYEAVPEHYNPNGTLHGGALFTVMDSSQGMLVHALLDPHEQAAATGTATIKYLAPVYRGVVSIRTWFIKREGRKLLIASEAVDSSGRQVARLDEVWIVLKPSWGH